MKGLVAIIIKITIITSMLSFVNYSNYAQGNILVRIEGIYKTSDGVAARTRIGSVNGGLAGPEILGQILVGLNEDSLSPVGVPVSHFVIDNQNSGWINIRTEIPIEIAALGVYGQLAVWDSSQWGTDIHSVPNSQFGYSDIVWASPYNGIGPNPLLIWNESAIVPNIPETSTIMLVMLGFSLIMIVRYRSS